MKEKKNKPQERYYLDDEQQEDYLTRQEARCMVCFLRGMTVKATADMLELSPRTVEYYVNNMKKRLSCSSKYDLVRLVIESKFPYNVNLDPLIF